MFHILAELFKDMSHSTIQGFFGVSGIFLFMAAIVAAAIYRIEEGKKHSHH